MEDKKKQKLIKALQEGKIKDETSLRVFEMVEDLNERLDSEIPKITDVISRMKGDKGDAPTDEELLKLIEPLIPVVEDGHTPTKEELLTLIRPLIPVVKNGQTPSKEELLKIIKPLIPTLDYDTVVTEASKLTEERLKPFIPTMEALQKDIPKLGVSIRDALELLQGEERLDIKSIKGIDELEKKIGKGNQAIIGGGLGGDAWHNGSGNQFGKITVSATQPENPAVNDIWFVLP